LRFTERRVSNRIDETRWKASLFSLSTLKDFNRATTRQMTEGDLADLERTAQEVQWSPDAGEEPTYHYCCFCRSGFSDGLRSTAVERDDLSVFTPSDIIR
jgi:hypothetical protein